MDRVTSDRLSLHCFDAAQAARRVRGKLLEERGQRPDRGQLEHEITRVEKATRLLEQSGKAIALMWG